ncbi:MAG TPA: palindromic element RPE4 domain-containing protein [Rickettsia endosymbiont of Omalisus fontisbellaquei]|nr:palindromic element RPE4 domain-containing protein [Rickettsia endosymbiont of Omalisus fontisbellaquei]
MPWLLIVIPRLDRGIQKNITTFINCMDTVVKPRYDTF